MRRWRGFTLVEILIVVVIIAVLAALILPMFTNQTEKAAVSEANEVLGTISRVQNMFVDSGAGFEWADTSVPGNWAMIGLTDPSSVRFTYACTVASCTATRAAGSGDYAGAVISVLSGNPKVWDCVGTTGTKKYAPLDTGGCTV